LSTHSDFDENMSSNQKTIVILGGARDYHAMHWYRAVRQGLPNNKVVFLVDLIVGEGFDNIIEFDDKIERLFIIDNLLMNKMSRLGNIWRNIIKLLVLPIQALLLKNFIGKNKPAIVHAHPMYYMLMCFIAGVEYIGRPQGSEILVRSKGSRIYRFFAKIILKKARYITVDSVDMSNEIYKISGVKAIVVQNGIDIKSIGKIKNISERADSVLSVRGISRLYRIEEIIQSRDLSASKSPLVFIYPFFEENYFKKVYTFSDKNDKFLGRLNKENMFTLLKSTKLVISIPISDSSPRSVYEAIFSGCCVAVTYNEWIEKLPLCMRQRLFIVNLESKTWFDDAVMYSNKIALFPYIASKQANEMFDEYLSISKIAHEIYK